MQLFLRSVKLPNGVGHRLSLLARPAESEPDLTLRYIFVHVFPFRSFFLLLLFYLSGDQFFEELFAVGLLKDAGDIVLGGD